MIRHPLITTIFPYTTLFRSIETERTLSQLIQNQWQTEHGLPQNAIHCMAQDRVGFIWIGTESGLVRFDGARSEEHTSELQSPCNLVCRLLLEKKKLT